MADNFEKLQCWQACQELNVFLKNEVLVIIAKT